MIISTIKNQIRIGFLILPLFFITPIKAQIVPIPVIDSLTVTLDNEIQLTWDVNDDPRITHFLIYKRQDVTGGMFRFDKISNTRPYTYIDKQSDVESQWQYTVAAIGQSDTLYPPMAEPFHGNIVLSFLDYNVCEPSINIEWLPYIGANNIKYSTICLLENEVYDQHNVGTARTGNIKLMYGKEHKIAVRATWNGGSSTSAFRTYRADSIHIDPNITITRILDTGNTYSIKLENEHKQHRDSIYIELFSPGAEQSYNKFAFKPEQTDTIEVSVPKTIPITEIKAYLKDTCQNMYDNGNKVGTINLTATDEITHVALQWNYVNPIDNFNYSLYYNNEIVANLITTDSYEYTLGSNTYDSDKICFQIQASNDTIEILSNTACLTLTDDLLWPNAFTPNGDGFDDQFGPIISRFIPENYTLLIFNKNGLSLFSSNSVDEKWGGDFNGKLVPIGGYIFQSEYSIAGKRYKKQGVVSVIY